MIDTFTIGINFHPLCWRLRFFNFGLEGNRNILLSAGPLTFKVFW